MIFRIIKLNATKVKKSELTMVYLNPIHPSKTIIETNDFWLLSNRVHNKIARSGIIEIQINFKLDSTMNPKIKQRLLYLKKINRENIS